MPEESTRKKVLLPFSKRKFRKSIKKGFYLTDDVNNDLTYFLRTNRTFKMVNGNKVKLDANIIKSGKELQSILEHSRLFYNPKESPNLLKRKAPKTPQNSQIW